MHRGSAGYATHPSDRSRGACQMSNVVELDSTGGGGKRARAQRSEGRAGAAPAARVEDRARAGRRRVHGRRLRDRGAAGARPAVHQPVGQRVRRLRRYERRLADRRAGRQRGHARADDAVVNDQPPASFARHGPRHCCCARTSASSWSRASSCRCTCSGRSAGWGATSGAFSLVDLAIAARGRAAHRPLQRRGGRRATCARCSPIPAAPTTSAGCACELYLAATDLDTCERIVLGADGWDDVPISAAVRASSALPMVYEPHVVKGRDLVDGGIVSTTNLDIAVEAGARLIVVVNPLVPFVNELLAGPSCGSRARRVTGDGLPEDRLPDLQARRLPAAARDGAPVAGATTRASTSC